MELELEEHTILIFRKIAHLRVESAKRTETAQPKTESTSWDAWSSWFWGTSQQTDSHPEDPVEEKGFTEDDWEKLTSAVDFRKEEAVDDTPLTLKLFCGYQLQSASLSLLDSEGNPFLLGNLSHTSASYKLYPKTQAFSFEVSEAVLSSPEGVLMTTVHQSANQKASAVSMEYIMSPQDADVSARIKLTTSSTYVKFCPASFLALKKFLEPAEQVDVSVLEAQALAQLKKVFKSIDGLSMEM